MTNPGYATRPASVTYYYTARDAFRTDNIKRTDLSLNYSIKIGGLVEIFVQPQVLNVFNNQGLVAVDTTVQTAVSPGTRQHVPALQPVHDDAGPAPARRHDGHDRELGLPARTSARPRAPRTTSCPARSSLTVGLRF